MGPARLQHSQDNEVARDATIDSMFRKSPLESPQHFRKPASRLMALFKRAAASLTCVYKMSKLPRFGRNGHLLRKTL